MAKVELVVIAAPQSGMSADTMATKGAPPHHSIASVLNAHGVSLEPIFPASLIARAGATTMGVHGGAAPLPDRMFRADVEEAQADQIVRDMLATGVVEAAYTKPAVSEPLAPPPPGAPPLTMAGGTGTPPDYAGDEGYLGPKPGGVDAAYAWSLEGGTGDKVTIIDIEGGWCLTHRDFEEKAIIPSPVPEYITLDRRNHGTAVLGVMGGSAPDKRGVQGIAPDATLGVVSHHDLGTARAIARAASMLKGGDIMLLEAHRPGPKHPKDDPSQLGYIAVEWWPDDWLAIQLATLSDIIVVEAAGNGSQNLDDAVYDASAGFPPWWRNPFRRGPMDSGAILVGAGAPPSGAYGPDRSRLDFSNYGTAVDCQGWGRGVVSTGYGDLFGSFEAEYYTRTFSGTSSASPMVAATLACLQGVNLAKGNQFLKPADMRRMLRASGSPQPAPASERIGSRPDLNAMITQL